MTAAAAAANAVATPLFSSPSVKMLMQKNKFRRKICGVTPRISTRTKRIFFRYNHGLLWQYSSRLEDHLSRVLPVKLTFDPFFSLLHSCWPGWKCDMTGFMTQPDRTFNNFIVWKPVHSGISCCSKSVTAVFWGTKIMKYLVGNHCANSQNKLWL